MLNVEYRMSNMLIPYSTFSIQYSIFTIHYSLFPIPSPHKIHDLDLIPLVDERGLVVILLDDDHVVLDGDAAAVDPQVGEEPGDRQRPGDFQRLAVDGNSQSLLQRHRPGCDRRSLRPITPPRALSPRVRPSSPI